MVVVVVVMTIATTAMRDAQVGFGEAQASRRVAGLGQALANECEA